MGHRAIVQLAKEHHIGLSSLFGQSSQSARLASMADGISLLRPASAQAKENEKDTEDKLVHEVLGGYAARPELETVILLPRPTFSIHSKVPKVASVVPLSSLFIY